MNQPCKHHVFNVMPIVDRKLELPVGGRRYIVPRRSRLIVAVKSLRVHAICTREYV